MYFDFKLFSAFATKAYKSVDNPIYSLEEVLAIFKYYFQMYEYVYKRPHPNIRVEQIERIIEIMPFVENDGCSSAGGDIDPSSYEVLIDKHFKTKYRNCNWNINHFFSGDIRLMRLYEELY